MKLEEGMFVRTNRGNIDKILLVEYAEEKKQQYPNHPSKSYWRDKIFLSKEGYWRTSQNIIKASHNIIDLIEYGDYVNGFKVIEFDDIDGDGNVNIELGIPVYEDACLNVISEYRPLSTIDIKSIVTKEQFEAMAYKVVEEC